MYLLSNEVAHNSLPKGFVKIREYGSNGPKERLVPFFDAKLLLTKEMMIRFGSDVHKEFYPEDYN